MESAKQQEERDNNHLLKDKRKKLSGVIIPPNAKRIEAKNKLPKYFGNFRFDRGPPSNEQNNGN